MQVPYNWLKSYIDFPYEPEELAHKLTMLGLEVESVDYLGSGMEGIVVGQITEIKEHPNADKLVICKVTTGHTELQVVTGAPNVREQALVPVAPTGVTLPNGMEIEETNLRGKMSEGMICSKDELGLMEERASGIMVLDDDAELGTPIARYLGLDDYVLKLDLTPNYARCLGLLGIAREIKALLPEQEINYPDINIHSETGASIDDYVSVSIEDPDLCPRYTGRLIRNIEIKPSPDWMQRRLEAAGIRPINNIVDITNYVLLEYNQPLHAFDYEQIADRQVIVRRAARDEKLVTLDEQSRELDQEVLVIADPKKNLGLAGVMGGANSEVTDQTSHIFLEAAYFDPVNIRRTARKLGLPSEASHRFERGIDIENVIAASNRAAYLMQEYAGGEVVEGIIDEYPQPRETVNIELESNRVSKLLGVELSTRQIEDILTRLDFKVETPGKGRLQVEVPSYRSDVSQEADLLEEIARIYGYNKIPVTRSASKEQGRRTVLQKLRKAIKSSLIASGLDEALTFSLMDERIYDKMGVPEQSELRNWVEIKNPLNKAFSLLRTSLVPGIIETLSNNSKRQLEDLRFFEMGRVFLADNGGRPIEKNRLAAGSAGFGRDPWQVEAPDFFYLKGVIEELCQRLGIDELSFDRGSYQYLHPGRTADIYFEDEFAGFLGQLHPDVIEEFDLPGGTALFQLDIDVIDNLVELDDYSYDPLPRHPAVSRDLAIVVEQSIPAAEIMATINQAGGELLKNIELFDLYQGDQIPDDHRSLAFKLLFQARDRTLTDKEVDQIFDSIVEALRREHRAEVRN